jgi:amidophosphoribosyltransferase
MFIEQRKVAVKEKLNPIKSVVFGKDIILLDDSIVRGTTTQQIVSMLRDKGGAKRVHLRISCPPIISPCYMGIDFPTKAELIAGRFQEQYGETYLEEIRREIGADTMLYQTIEGLTHAIGKSKDQLCLACLTSDYPLKSVQRLAELEKSIVRSRT